MDQNTAQYTEELHQVRWNLIVFLAVFVPAAVLFAFTGGWRAYVSAFVGWGLVIMARLFYVFIIERWRMGSTVENQSVRQLVS